MLRTLLESRAIHARRTGGTLVSVGAHTAIISLAIVATARATPPRTIPKVGNVPDVIFTPAPVHERPTHSARRGGAVSDGYVRDRFPEAPTFRFPTTPPVSDVLPSRIDSPPIDWGSGHAGPSRTEGEFLTPAGGIYGPNQVEKAAIPRPGNPAPVYPAALRAAQIEGSVVARFVVDTTGLAEPQSIAFSEASHAQFAEAVRQSLLRSRYLPAMVGDRRVRQLVEQHFAFTLTR